MNPIETKYGTFVPQHTNDDLRKREIMDVEYHESGAVKSIPLEEQAIIETEIGTIPAELVSFHENGNLNRIFPLNGKLSGYWSQDDEAALAKPATLKTPIGTITTKVLSLSFYDDQSLRSLTLWPDETLSVNVGNVSLVARIGISFTRDGKIASVEPAKPTQIETTLGNITAFDPDAVGVNGDINSLQFDDSGEVTAVTTTLTKIACVSPDGSTNTFIPKMRESWCGDSAEEVVPMQIVMTPEDVAIYTDPDEAGTVIPREGHVFFAESHLPQLAMQFGELRCSI